MAAGLGLPLPPNLVDRCSTVAGKRRELHFLVKAPDWTTPAALDVRCTACSDLTGCPRSTRPKAYPDLRPYASRTPSTVPAKSLLWSWLQGCRVRIEAPSRLHRWLLQHTLSASSFVNTREFAEELIAALCALIDSP